MRDEGREKEKKMTDREIKYNAKYNNKNNNNYR